jgi:multidrug efflux pump subunit AcrB
VLEARVAGALEREVKVKIDPARLNQYNLSLFDVTGAIQREHVTIPGGVSQAYVDARTPQVTVATSAPSSPAVNDVWIDSDETGGGGSVTPGTYWEKWTGTQAAYDALGTYDADVLYVIVG